MKETTTPNRIGVEFRKLLIMKKPSDIRHATIN